jgi:hypothetical protein
MRRTVLSALALACTAVLASTVPAFADGASPSPRTATEAPSTAPSDAPKPDESKPATPEPSTGGTEAPAEVSVVPKGAPDTGEASTESGGQGGLIGGSAAAVFALGGAAFYVVRRRQATGA